MKEMNRREFLKGVVGIAGALLTENLVGRNNALAGVMSKPRKKTEEFNEEDLSDQKIDINDQIIEQEISAKKVEITPEYQRNIEKILLAIPTSQEFSPKFIHRIYHDLLIKLPLYSNIQILIKSKQVDNFRKLIKNIQKNFPINLEKRIKMQIIDDGDNLDLWAQDFGELVKIDGEETFIIPADLREDIFLEAAVSRDIRRKKVISEKLKEQGIKIIQADIYFDGGNVTFDRTEKGMRLFVGYADVYYSRHNKATDEEKISPQGFAKKMSRIFGGAEVVVMGNRELIGDCFHIDQAFIILDNKKVVINQCEQRCMDANADVDINEQLKYYKAQLEALGYETIVINNTPEQIRNSFSSTNAIPFVDKISGVKKILVPVFPDEIKSESVKKKEIGLNDLQGKGIGAYMAYIKAGYEPIFVRDHSYIDKGNIHCISNVFAKKENSDSTQLDGVA